ncbi:DUF4913 domain-containing protein [Streptomyces sp. P9-2]|jgi:hypothetical protein|uniref:DUF4913 domain-containing protein n=1 Tax=Streptomyces sp. P9-2 TaxID=3423201 RepID=UPI001998A85C|nr:DUF4913 domain-containing protein [Streptomyces cellulosae]
MMSDRPAASPEAFRLADGDLEDLASTLARTVNEVNRHGTLLDRLASEAGTETSNPHPRTSPADPSSVFILALGGDAYTAELQALADWVNLLLLPVYGREVNSTRPWCSRWHEHPEAVARLHGLWLAWQQLTDVEAGLTGPATWHRDHLDHTMAQLRAPDGPFAACTTSPSRPAHRLLSAPEPTAETTA